MKNISATNKGLLAGVLMAITSAIFFYALKIPFNSKEQFAVFLIYTVAILWSLFSVNETSKIKFKDYFLVGFKTFIVVTLLMVVYSFIFYTFNTSIRDAWIANNNTMLLKEGNHVPTEIEENAKQMKKIFLPMMVGINLFKYLILGSLITAIASAVLIAKNKN